MEREIVVKGEGEGRSLPDRAVIGLTVEAQSPSRDTAYQEAAEAAKQIDEVIESHRQALGRVTTAALVVQQTTRWHKGEYLHTGWRAGRTTRLEVTGFDQLGAVIAELTSAGGAISGPRWEIDAGNPVHRDTRRAAAEDARRRAEDYAAALGLKIAGVAWISEPGLRGPSLEAGHSVRALAAAPLASRSEDADEVIEVTPEELTIWASVEVGFSLAVQSPGATA
ncbi:MAG: SIMPL domain-containing protein [Acidimicrobiaceae bacterium]|nr:SIMPL domain-containing protein [Acidimicrobiaceae bacterium]MBO0747163.1 SIMPL domain-containing protein [Acidimicrobiaceae bacterium]